MVSIELSPSMILSCISFAADSLETLDTMKITDIFTPSGGLEFGPLKTKASNRTITVGAATISMLKEHQKRQLVEIKSIRDTWQNYDLVFPSTIGTPFHPPNQLRRFKWLLIVPGLPEIRNHDLGNTAASLMLNHGVPILVVSKRLGHFMPLELDEIEPVAPEHFLA